MLLEWWERYRRLLLTVVALLFIGSSLWLYEAGTADQAEAATQPPLVPPAYATAAADSATAKPGQASSGKTEAVQQDRQREGQQEGKRDPLAVFVDVKGSVNHPGLYRLDAGMRVADAIAKAGGVKANADLDQINLAAPLTDGTAIVVPVKGSGPAAVSQDHSPAGYQPASAASTTPTTSESVNINTATAEQLMGLPGIGEARANAILRYRQEKGGFRSPEQLKEIPGIGDKMYDRIKDRIRIH